MNKELFSKKNLMPVAVLSVICIAVALLLGVANLITAPEIERRNNEAIFESLRIVIPDGEFNPEPDPLRDDAPETVKKVYTEKTGKGTVIILETTKGYTGKAIGITTAIDNDGKIINTVITKNEESIVPPSLKPMGTYGDAYKDATADTVADVETGATVRYTEAAIKGALKDAFTYLGVGGEEVEKLPRTDAELKELITADGWLAPGAELENITPEEKSETLKRLYKLSDGSFAAYIVTATQYVPVETEALVHIDEDGSVMAIKKLSWVVGHGPENDPPAPDESQVNEFFGSFVGKDTAGIDGIDVTNGATGTSTHLRDAVKDAVDTAVPPLPRSDSELSLLIAELAPDTAFEIIAPEEKSETLKRLYKLSDGSFMAYIVTATQYVPVETEALVHIDADGSVIAIKKLSWVVGHGPENDPPAPDESQVNEFFGSFVGKDTAGIDGIDVTNGATGTSTHLRDAVKNAVDIAVPPLPRSNSELLGLAEQLMPNAQGFENVTPEGSKLLKRLYKDVGGNGYVAYLNTFAQYGGTLESETLIAIDNNGKIIAVKNLFWKVGHGPESNPPAPNEAEVAEFFGDFVGKKERDLSSVVIAGATGTASNVRAAILEALEAVPAKESQAARVIGIVLLTLSAAAGAVYVVRRKLV
ncbi:MAG: hypothetical protein E7617_00560 [Ruminococcaceae bacterium]|nr:hypothetical protein [Oscillospiraceae bacterium]